MTIIQSIITTIIILFIITIIRSFFDEKYGMCSCWKRPWKMIHSFSSIVMFTFTGISSSVYIQNALNTHNYEITITIFCGFIVILSALSVLISIVLFIITPFIPSHYLM